ncbi:hypothetical protein JW916_03565 [Candidatus Sumerlaeota bacterium]|nr:hypothetical protein [Candidatus Sumerlaeota bacterium]
MTEPELDSIEKMLDAAAANLAQAAAGWAFHLFQDKKFRRLAEFDRIEQVEQDRIFNELVVSALVLIMLVFDAPDLRVPDDFKDQLVRLSRKVSRAYVENLRQLGLEEEHLETWDQLIALRYEEYERDKLSARAAMMKIESAEKELDVNDLSKIQMVVPVQTVAVGCHHHVCRGETDGRDDLFLLTLKSLSRFYLELRVHIEGGRITPLMRARVAAKRTLRRLRRKKR